MKSGFFYKIIYKSNGVKKMAIEQGRDSQEARNEFYKNYEGCKIVSCRKF